MASIRIGIDSSDAVRGANAAKEALKQVGGEALTAEESLKRLSQQSRELAGALRESAVEGPFGLRTAIPQADALIQKIEQIKAARAGLQVPVEFGAGLSTPFGAGLGGAFSAEELGFSSAVTGAQALSSALLGVGTAGKQGVAAAMESVEQLAASTLGAAERMQEAFSLQRAVPTSAGINFATLEGGGAVVDPRGLAMIEAQDRAVRGLRTAYGTAEGGAKEYGVSATSALGSVPFASHLRSIAAIGATFAGIRGIHDVVNTIEQFDDALLEIHESTGLAGADLEALDQKLVGMSTAIAVPVDDLRRLAAVAGRLQIKSPEGIEQFVRDMGNLRASVPGVGGNIQDFANRVGAVFNLTEDGVAGIGKMADAIALLGNKFNSSGEAILETAIFIGRAGSGFIKSSADVLGLAAAISSLGTTGRLAGSGVASILTSVQTAVEKGGPALETLEQLLGKTREQIKESFKADAGQALVDMMKRISEAGAEQEEVLQRLGFASAEDAKAVLPLIEHYDLLQRGLDTAKQAQQEGGEAAQQSAQRFATLGGELLRMKNIFSGLTTESGSLGAGLRNTADFLNQVAASFLGASNEGQKVSSAAETVAAGLEGAAKAAAVLVAVNVGSQMFSWAKGAYAAATANEALAATYAELVPLQATLGGGAFGTIRAVAPAAGLGSLLTSTSGILGAATAVGALVAGISALSSALGSDDIKKGVEDLRGLDGLFQKLSASVSTLNDARGIQVRADLSGNATDKLRGLEEELRATNAAADAVGGELAAKHFVLPAPKFKELGIQDLAPELSALQSSLTTALDAAVKRAQENVQLPDFFDAVKAGFQGGGFGAAEILQKQRGEAAAKAFTEAYGQTIEQLVGPTAAAALKPDLEKISPETRKIVVRAVLEGDAGAIAELAPALEKDGIQAVRTSEVLRLLDQRVGSLGDSIERQKALVDAQDKVRLKPILSDFYKDEAAKIRDEITQAQLAIGEFTQPLAISPDATGTGKTFFGLEAEIKAAQDATRAYDELVDAKYREINFQGRSRESDDLKARAAQLEQVRLASIRFNESQRILGERSDLLSRNSGVLGEQLRNLGLSAQGETSFAFDNLRKQIELTTKAEVEQIRSAHMLADGSVSPDAEPYLKLAEAQHQAAQAGVNLRERLHNSARGINEIGDVARTSSGAIADALLGIQSPADAARQAIQSLVRDFVQPQLEGGFLALGDKFFGPKKETPEAPSPFRVAAQQGGTLDIFERSRGEGPPPPGLPDFRMPELADVDATFAKLGAGSSLASDKLLDVATGAGVAAPHLEDLATGATAAGAGLDEVTTAAAGTTSGLDAATAALLAFTKALEFSPSLPVTPFIGPPEAPRPPALELPAVAAPVAPQVQLPTPGIQQFTAQLPPIPPKIPAADQFAAQLALQQPSPVFFDKLALPARPLPVNPLRLPPVSPQLELSTRLPQALQPGLGSRAAFPALLPLPQLQPQPGRIQLPQGVGDATKLLGDVKDSSEDAARALEKLPRVVPPSIPGIEELGSSAAKAARTVADISNFRKLDVNEFTRNVSDASKEIGGVGDMTAAAAKAANRQMLAAAANLIPGGGAGKQVADFLAPVAAASTEAAVPIGLAGDAAGAMAPELVLASNAVNQFSAALAAALLQISVQKAASVATDVGTSFVAGVTGGSTGGTNVPLQVSPRPVGGGTIAPRGGDTYNFAPTIVMQGGGGGVRQQAESGMKFSARQIQRDFFGMRSRR